MVLNAEVTSKIDGDKMAHENARQAMLHVIAIIEWHLADPRRVPGSRVRVDTGRTITKAQLEEIGKLYKAKGWMVSVTSSTNGLDCIIHLT